MQKLTNFLIAKQKNIIRNVTVLVFSSSMLITVYAGEESNSESSGFSAQLLTQYQYDDNILSDSNNIIDAYVFLIRPEGSWIFEKGANQFTVVFSNETAKYEGSSEDNYSDNYLDLRANVELNSKHRLNMLATIADTHQRRGSGFSTGNGSAQTDVDTFNQNDIELRYIYGRESTAAQLDLYYNHSTVDFDQRSDIFGNDVTLIRDRTDSKIGAEFSYSLTAKTDFVLDVNRTELDYDVETGLGNTVDALLVGITWQASTKTRGRALIGSQDRERTIGGSSDDTIWQIGIDWSPRSYSTISLNSSKSSQASIGIGNSRNVASTSVTWDHEWSSQFISNMGYSKQSTDFIGTNTSTDTTSLNVGIAYLFGSNMSLSLDYANTERESDITNSQLMFDREVIGINFVLTYE